MGEVRACERVRHPDSPAALRDCLCGFPSQVALSCTDRVAAVLLIDGLKESKKQNPW